MTAAHGIEALSKIEVNQPDLILTDLMMPKLNGADLCRTLRSEPQTRSIPIILMSSVDASVAETIEADAFIAKPFHLDEVEDLVAYWVQSSHPM